MKSNRAVVFWLLTGCFLIFIMVLVGGITRLTNSGLSMTDWKLVTDMIPPLTEEKWEVAFEKYKQFPEYQKINIHYDFTIEDYKFIYFWEWLHRLLGRLLGIVFIIPFLYFLIKKKFDPSTLRNCIILLALGALQGFLGWFMVKSGLIDHPDVSHYRLALHLITAFITFAFCIWVALNLIYGEKKHPFIKLRNLLRVAWVVLIIQIVWGAFVAGLGAGYLHNTWPLMNDGKFIHETVYIEQNPLWKNFVEGKSGVQFVHRTLAYIVVGLMFYIAIISRRFTLDTTQRKGINAIMILVSLQFILGIFTMVYGVPLWLGIAHQIGAFLLLGGTTFALHRFSR